MGVDVGRRTENWGLYSAIDFLGGLQYIRAPIIQIGNFISALNSLLGEEHMTQEI